MVWLEEIQENAVDGPELGDRLRGGPSWMILLGEIRENAVDGPELGPDLDPSDTAVVPDRPEGAERNGQLGRRE
jgi:hypothetical protein